MESPETMMPSRYGIGQSVIVHLFGCGRFTGFISAITFNDKGKVRYDVSLYPFTNEPDNKEIITTLKDIDSYFVATEYDEQLGNCNWKNILS